MAGKKIQSQVTAYHEFVISQLVDIDGTSTSDVIARIIGNWIDQNQDYLSRINLSKESWVISTRARAHEKESDLDNVIAYSKQRGSSKEK